MPLPMKTRLCRDCDEALPESEFHASELRRNYPRCKKCRSTRCAKAYKNLLKGDPKPGERLCWECDQVLPESAFYADQLRRSRALCKECKKAKVAGYHRRLKEDRKCFHCRVPLAEDDESLCKGCKALARARYHANGDERRAFGRRYKRNLKQLVFEAYGGAKCACCGEEVWEFLTIDHINDDGADHRREMKEKHGYVVEIYRWLKNNNFPKGFQVLCWNCNCAKAHYGICPHEVERRNATQLRVVRG